MGQTLEQVDIEEVIGAIQQPESQEPSSATAADTAGNNVAAGSEVPTTPGTDLAKLPAWGVGDGFLAEYERISVRVAKSLVLPAALAGDARNVLAVALAGRELGVGFFESMRHIHLINGQTALSSELKVALAKRAGLVIDSVDESNGCKITAHRADTGEKGVGEFTPDDKRLAKLGESARSGWATYPKDMYYARAAARLIRRLMPDAKGASFRSLEELTETTGELE